MDQSVKPQIEKSPLVTIVMPTYNHGDYLASAIESVFSQSYNNWELFVIDNHSTDNTDQILAKYSDPRLTVIKIQNQGVIAKSRNAALDFAKGEWVAFLDSDDWWSVHKLKECSGFFMDSFDFIYHDLIVETNDFTKSAIRRIFSRRLKEPVLLDLLIKGNTIATSSVVVRKSIIEQAGRMDEKRQLIGTEDYNTWLKISRITEKFKHIAKPLGSYRIHAKNVSDRAEYSPPRLAVEEFLVHLSKKQRIRVESNFIYSRARTNYLSGNHNGLLLDLIWVLRTGRLDQVLKSLWMLVIESIYLVNIKLRGK